MSISTNRDREAVDRALSYPEPPASSLWHRHGPQQTRPLTPAQQRRNRELLAHAQYSPRSRSTQPAA
ncbi:hypothetical protein OIF23_30890 (plasmid) [Streptomyces albidoflavus]|uniref:hypothetical protein n=1 Tax=Streptomyces albidoflavus TaxID=1886 RepID=UPI00387391B7|nr:hypothetical protein OIF23_30890 [Streptomyces albidoflavus]